ncbi:probable methyltransferase TARBP1 [Protopterus annectens]|uniref:probable methyltransferase TARBP1 n=1 Tax=Protopterus annectens TaxID=7888 RepID=UPI001CFC3118|nr:probable methyltransferase TARBP1 [Protopterus annectens]
METGLLLDVLLANCKDRCALLDEVCWQDDELFPEVDRVETLQLIVQRLAGEVQSVGGGDDCVAKTRLREKVRYIACSRCLPLLRRLGASGTALNSRVGLARTVGKLLSCCLEICGKEDTIQQVLYAVLSSMRSDGSIDEGRKVLGDCLEVDTAIEVFRCMSSLISLTRHPDILDQVIAAVMGIIKGELDKYVTAVVARLLPSLMQNQSYASCVIHKLWKELQNWLSAGLNSTTITRILLCLCSLADYFFPTVDRDTEVVIDLRFYNDFWKIVQLGITHEDSISRKRATYLLKRAVDVSDKLKDSCESSQDKVSCLFWWSSENTVKLLHFWENFILILETVEENQVHVIKPILPKLSNLIESSVLDSEGYPLFHVSWFTCIYTRMIHNENKTIMKEGVTHFLNLSVFEYSLVSLGFAEFVSGHLMDALSDSNLYNRSPDEPLGTCPSVGLQLSKFFQLFVRSLPEETQGQFVLHFVQKMASRHWYSVPIFFISKALASIPACKLWGKEGLLALRDILQCTMITHQVLLRAAAQCCLLQIAMNLTDVSRVTFDEVSTFLMFLRPEESLSRKTSLWNQLCEWLRANDGCFLLTDSNASAELARPALHVYVEKLVEQYLKVPSVQAGDCCLMPDCFRARLVATLIVLASDVEERNKMGSDAEDNNHEVLACFLYPLLDALSKLNTYAYMPTLKTDKSLQLLLKLLQICCPRHPSGQIDLVLSSLQTSVLSVAEHVLEFILRRLTSELHQITDLDRCDLYIAVLRELLKVHAAVGWKCASYTLSFIASLTESSIRNLQATSREQDPDLASQIQKVASMASLAWVCETASQNEELQLDSLAAVKLLIRYISSAEINQLLRKPMNTDDSSRGLEDGTSARGWGRLAARYCHDHWICLHFVLHQYSSCIQSSNVQLPESARLHLPAVEDSERTLRFAVEALAILPSDNILPVLRSMKILVPKLWSSAESLCVECMETAWKVILSLSNNQQVFWPILKAFIRFVFDQQLLAVDMTQGHQVFMKLKELTRSLIEMSRAKTGVFNLLIQHCCQVWLSSASNDDLLQKPFLSARNHIEIVSEACVFGYVFRRDQRLLQDVHTFIESLGDECAANAIVESCYRDDQFVRVTVIDFLCRLDGSDVLHKKFIEDLVVQLLEKDFHVVQSTVKWHCNSLQHYLANRVWLTIPLTFPQLPQEFVSKIVDTIYQAGYSNNQASVKYLIEWTIILLLHSYPQFLDMFWNCFSYDQEKIKTSICTFMSVLTHFDIILLNVSDKTPFLKKALDVIILWCFHHNFSVRLYALVALKKVWSICLILHEEEFKSLKPVIESCLQQIGNMQGTGNARKNWQRIQDHFFFVNLQPLKDYSIEILFYILPSLSGLPEEECIPTWKFARLADVSGESTVPLYSFDSGLHGVKCNDWTQQDKDCSLVDMDSPHEWADIQKKMIPWKNSIPELDLEMVYKERATRLGKSSSSLIVVASLLDKLTNVGGLCRTCEIFGASALIVESLHCTADKQFQSLSVSAEHWLPLIEVKPPQLIDYLQQKKTEGYTVVGAEQTAKSCNLTEYSFSEKTLLLLGNEREGIPANLIQHLDVCVEIPQQGITRSLNVHVSGALFIWEYTRQQMLKHKAQQSNSIHLNH